MNLKIFKKYKKLVLILCVSIFLMYSTHMISSIIYVLKKAENTQLVEVKMTPDKPLKSSVYIYRISGNNKLIELQRKGKEWVSDNSCYVNGIILLTKKKEPALTGSITVRIGSKERKFGINELEKFGTGEAKWKAGINFEKYDVFKIPENFKLNNTIIFHSILGKTINWKGDKKILDMCLFLAVIYAAVYAFIFFISILIFRKIIDYRVYLIFIFVLTIVITSFFAVYQIDPHHDGIMLKPAVDMDCGKMLFRDTFLQYGPLSTILQAFTIKIFGLKLITIRLLTVFFYGLIAVLIWVIYSRILSKFLNAVLYFIWMGIAYYLVDYVSMVFMPWSTGFCIFTVLAAVYLLIKYVETGRISYMFICGAAVSCVFWFKINYGITTLVIFIPVILIIENFSHNIVKAVKSAFYFCAGWAAISLMFFVWIALNGAISDFWLQSVKFAMEFSKNNWNDNTNYPLPVKILLKMFQINSEHGFKSFIWTLAPLICVFYALKILPKLCKKEIAEKKDKVIFIISAVAAGLWINYFPVNSIFHMYLTATPMLGMAVYLAWDAGRKMKYSRRLTVFIIIMMMLFAYDIFMRSVNIPDKVRNIFDSVKMEEPGFLQGMRVSPEEAGIYREMNGIIKDDGGGIVNITNAGLYSLFDPKGLDFHKMYVNWGWVNNSLYPDYLLKLKDRLDRRKGLVISGTDVIIDNYYTMKIYRPLGGEFSERVVISKPGKEKEIFAAAEAFVTEDPAEKNRYTIKIEVKNLSESPVNIDSIIVRSYADELDSKKFGYNEFKHDVLPRAKNVLDRQVIVDSFVFEPEKNIYCLKKGITQPQRSKLKEAFLNLFLYGSIFKYADSFNDKNPNKLYVYKNREEINCGKTIKTLKNDILKIIASMEKKDRENIASVVMVRINYNSGLYSDIIVNLKEGKLFL